MNGLSDMYAQLDNIVSKFMEMDRLNELDEEFRFEYLDLRDECINDFSRILMPQYNYDESISLEMKQEIVQLFDVYYDLTNMIQTSPDSSIYAIHNKVENILIHKYMSLNGYKKDSNNSWTK